MQRFHHYGGIHTCRFQGQCLAPALQKEHSRGILFDGAGNLRGLGVDAGHMRGSRLARDTAA